MYILIGLALALSVGIGTTAVAESSQEGDMLYSVKTNVNDRIEATLDSMFSAEADVEAEADANAEASAAGGTYLTADEGGEDFDKMDTDLDASVETDANAGVNLNL